jgi:hypothetical protein
MTASQDKAPAEIAEQARLLSEQIRHHAHQY